MQTVTKYIEDEVFESTNENGNKISIDMRSPDKKQSLSPMEILSAAVSGCAAVDIVEILKKRKKTIDAFEIITSGERRAEHPRGYSSLESKYIVTSPDVKEEELYKVADLALNKYCSVASSLNVEVQFSVEVIRS